MERIQLRRDISTKWTEINPILMEGEVGFEIDTKLRKIGDGITAWNNLDYLAAENVVQELGDSETAVISQKTITNTITDTIYGNFFTIKGYGLRYTDGVPVSQSSENYVITPFINLNREADLTVSGWVGAGNVALLCFYDKDKVFISSLFQGLDQGYNKDYLIKKEDFPLNATFIRASGINYHSCYVINTTMKHLMDSINDTSANYDYTGEVTANGNPIVLNDTSAKPFTELTIPILSPETLVTLCGRNFFIIDNDMRGRRAGGCNYKFDNNIIYITSDGTTELSVSSGSNFPTKYKYLNNKEWWHNFKFKFSTEQYVTVTGNCSVPQPREFLARLTVSDGTTTLYVGEAGLTFKAKAGIEYGIRILVRQGFVGDIFFKPQIEIGTHKTEYEPINGGRWRAGDHVNLPVTLRDKRGSRLGTTTIFTDNDSPIVAVAQTMGVSEKANEGEHAKKIIDTLTSYKGVLSKPRSPIITFIDDDTTNMELVKRYHDLMLSKGVYGNYAVMTRKLNEQPGLSDLLLQYEQEGFGCIYHCYYQSGDETRYWEPQSPTYNEALIKENFMRGLRDMNNYGFSNYKHFVTPYGVNHEFVRNLAKRNGMETLISMSSGITDECFISMHGNCIRYNIPRLAISENSNIDKLKEHIDSCVADNGWIVFVTHANAWDSEGKTENKILDIIQYALDSGMQVKSFPEAFETYRSSFYFNELF